MFKHQDLQMFGIKLNKDEYSFHSLGVVRHDSETQLKVAEKLTLLAYPFNG